MTGNRERGTGNRGTRTAAAAPDESRDPPFPVTGSPFPCFASTAPGLEGLLAHELTALGVQPYDQEPGGITFEADQRQLYAANLHLRTAGRVVVRIAAFKAAHFAELEQAAGRVEWTRWVSPGTAVHFRITSRKSRLYHQKAIADRLEAAVLRTVADAVMVRKADEADAQEHVQQFIVRLAYDQCVISADSSGALLHQRGYRQAVAKAPLRETLAAAMLLGAEWDPATPLLDPMCGSGTIAIEAALLARRIPPGRHRRFAFERWEDFDARRWVEVRTDAEARVLPAAPAPIHASDRDAGAIEATRANAERAGVLEDLTLRQGALSAVEPPAGRGLLLTNPPYGLRIGEADRLRDLYARLGQLMSGPLAGWRLGLLVANAALAAQVGVELTERWSTTNGGIHVHLAVS